MVVALVGAEQRGGFNTGPYNAGYSNNYGGAHIPILSYENVNNGDGNYRYRYLLQYDFTYVI